MDSDLLFLIICSTLVFVGLVAWKVIWIYKKIIQEELRQSRDDSGKEIAEEK